MRALIACPGVSQRTGAQAEGGPINSECHALRITRAGRLADCSRRLRSWRAMMQTKDMQSDATLKTVHSTTRGMPICAVSVATFLTAATQLLVVATEAHAGPRWHIELEDYKLGDALKGWNRKSVHQPFIDYCCNKFPGSIVCDYRRRTKTFSNIEVLVNITGRRALLYHNAQSGCLSLPRDDVLVVQIRLGDIIMSGDCFAHSHLCPKMVIDSKCWPQLAKKYKAEFSRPIVLVSNHHRNRKNKQGIEFSLRCREHLVNWINKTFGNTNITYRDNCQPDHDFVFLSQARHLLMSHGGFASLARKTAEKTGSHVLSCVLTTTSPREN